MIDPVHNSNLQLSIRTFKSSPTESIYITANEVPLWIHRIKTTLTFAAKVTRNKQENIIPKHIKLIIKSNQLNLSNIIKYKIIQIPGTVKLT